MGHKETYRPDVALDKAHTEEIRRQASLARRGQDMDAFITVRSINVSDFNFWHKRIADDMKSDKFFVTFRIPVPINRVAALIGESCAKLEGEICTK